MQKSISHVLIYRFTVKPLEITQLSCARQLIQMKEPETVVAIFKPFVERTEHQETSLYIVT